MPNMAIWIKYVNESTPLIGPNCKKDAGYKRAEITTTTTQAAKPYVFMVECMAKARAVANNPMTTMALDHGIS
jgi:hypothetical protein